MKVAKVQKKVTDIILLSAIEKAISKEEPFEKVIKRLGITMREVVDRIGKIREGSNSYE